MASDESGQVVLGTLAEQQIVGGKEDAVAVVTRASDGVVEVMVAAKEGAGIKAVMAVLHTEDERVELVGEGQVSIPEKCLARPLFEDAHLALPPQPKEEPRTSQTQIVVEVTGSTVKKTTDPQEMAGDESVQVVLGALTEQQIVSGKEDAVAVVTRASDGVVEVMVAAKDGAGVKAVMAVLHTGDGRVELVGEG